MQDRVPQKSRRLSAGFCYALKARVQLARCEYQSALNENKYAIDLNPFLTSAYCGLAYSLAYEGRYKEAIEGFEELIKLSPNDPQRWAFLTYGALAHIYNKDFNWAIKTKREVRSRCCCWNDRSSTRRLLKGNCFT
jgi:tetratricopeptide (TPR) repeat protein